MVNPTTPNLGVSLNGLNLKNPIIPASGTFGFGYEYADFYDLNCLGAISIKGTTVQPRFGNPTPRIAETASGMLNAVGLQNPGVEAVIAEELPRLQKVYSQPVIANISGFTVADYVMAAGKIDACEQVGLLEINISCPNVHNGAMVFGVDPKSAAEVTRQVKSATNKPIYIKLSPNVTDIAEIAMACENAGADGISLINTLMGMRLNLTGRSPILANRTGGISGPAVLPIALRMVWEVFEKVSIPIIGMGGVSSAEDVVEMMLAGASAVQIGTANLINPLACPQIINDLPALLQKLGVSKISELIGSAH